MAWFEQFRPDDWQAIQWLQTHAPRYAVVLQANGGSYSDAGWVAAITGLPTLLGWGGHELQWRGNYDEPGRREPVIRTIYQSMDVKQVKRLLDEYDVEYVYIGPVEQRTFQLSRPQVEKFNRFMERVYAQGAVTIYRRYTTERRIEPWLKP